MILCYLIKTDKQEVLNVQITRFEKSCEEKTVENSQGKEVGKKRKKEKIAVLKLPVSFQATGKTIIILIATLKNQFKSS